MTNSNFSFLSGPWTSYAENCAAAERLLYTDPNSCIAKLGNFAECVTRDILNTEGLPVPQNQFDRIGILKSHGLLSPSVENALHTIRKARNKTDHEAMNICNTDADLCLRCAYTLARWFAGYYGRTAPDIPFQRPSIPQPHPYSRSVSSDVPDYSRVSKKPSTYIPQPVPSESHVKSGSAVRVLSVLLAISVLLNIIQFLVYHFGS